MQKIILDTNVIISGLISNSIPKQILYEIVFNELVIFCLSTEIYEEYVDVLNRDKFLKFANFKENSNIVLSKINELAKIYQPKKQVDVLKDKSDNKFLALASVSACDFLITGNTQDFTISEFEYTKIVTPREYWDFYKP